MVETEIRQSNCDPINWTLTISKTREIFMFLLNNGSMVAKVIKADTIPVIFIVIETDFLSDD